MARFYGEMRGDRGAVTRTGHASMSAHVRAWDVGVRIESRPGKADAFDVYATSGSNGAGADVLVATVKRSGGASGPNVVDLFERDGSMRHAFTV